MHWLLRATNHPACSAASSHACRATRTSPRRRRWHSDSGEAQRGSVHPTHCEFLYLYTIGHRHPKEQVFRTMGCNLAFPCFVLALPQQHNEPALLASHADLLNPHLPAARDAGSTRHSATVHLSKVMLGQLLSGVQHVLGCHVQSTTRTLLTFDP